MLGARGTKGIGMTDVVQSIARPADRIELGDGAEGRIVVRNVSKRFRSVEAVRERLGLATALLGDPRVLILDEPGSGLDPEGLAWLRGLLRSLAASGRTVLVSSHRLTESAQFVDRVVILSKGAQVFEGVPADVHDN